MAKHYLSDLIKPDDERDCFKVEGKKLMYVKTKDGEFVTSSKCPHAGGNLCKGDMVGDVVTCPRHHYKYDVKTGENVSGEGYQLPTYKIKSDSDGKYFELPD